MAIWNEEYYNGLLSSLDEVLQAQQRDVIAVICRRLKAVGELNPTSVKQLVQLARWQRADLAEIKKLIRKYSGLSAAEVEKAFRQAAKDSAEYADVLAQQAKGVTYAANTELLAKAAAKTYVDEILNMSDTYAFKTSFGTLPIRQTYIKAVNKAAAAVSTGTLDYNTAIQQTIKELADSGLRNAYIDGDVAPAKVRWMNENGETYYTRRVDSSVRMNVLEGVRRINQEILNDAGEKYATGYEISAHDRPAPDHADIQGRQYTTAAFEQLNASLVRPIGTLNCMHIAFPIIYGVSKPAYTDEQLAEFKANAGKQYEYKGKTLSGYECTQQQRKYETAIRRAKDRANAFEAAGDKTNAARERRRARELGREYREFSEHVGLSVKTSRTQTLKTHGESFALEKPEKMGYNSGAKSGAYNNKNDPDGSKRDAHANMYYEELRNSKKQNIVSSIAQNSGVNESTVSNVYDHLLINEYDLGGETRRFDTDYDIAESLQRLITGKNIQEHDIVLLRHEALEYILMNEDGLSYVEAHSMANESFNYAEALKKFLKGSGE